jgi:quinol monooxygenase YgiN
MLLKFNKQFKTLKVLETDNEEIKKRKIFIVKLANLRLPMPQNEGQWHSARIYIDELKKSVYIVEQWEDYLKLKNKHPYYDFIRDKEYTKIDDKKKIKYYRNMYLYC